MLIYKQLHTISHIHCCVFLFQTSLCYLFHFSNVPLVICLNLLSLSSIFFLQIIFPFWNITLWKEITSNSYLSAKCLGVLPLQSVSQSVSVEHFFFCLVPNCRPGFLCLSFFCSIISVRCLWDNLERGKKVCCAVLW